MGKERPERITYAQKKLLDLIDRRELRSWCAEHNLPHTTVYRLALGESIATYAMICSMVHLIPPCRMDLLYRRKDSLRSKDSSSLGPGKAFCLYSESPYGL